MAGEPMAGDPMAGEPMAGELVRLAQRVKGFMPHAEGTALWRAALDANAHVGAPLAARPVTPPADPPADPPVGFPLMEIGSYCGKSAIYLGAAARQLGQTLFTVDHHRGSEEMQAGTEHHDAELVDPTTGRFDSLPWLRATLTEADLERSVVALVGYSTIVAAHWRTPLALLFIDGGHGRDVAHADYDAWVPHVAPGGTLAIHDVFSDPAQGGQPPYELYLRALADGFVEVEAVGSLRVLRASSSAASSTAAAE